MNRYVVVIRRVPDEVRRVGPGLDRIATTASSADQAARQVCDYLLAPHNIVVRVEDKGEV